MFTENPQDTTVLLGEQAVFSCTLKNATTLPEWTDTNGVAYTIYNTAGDVRYIRVNNTKVSLSVTATPARDGVCFSCIIDSIVGPVESARGCLTVDGKQSMSILTMCTCLRIHAATV